MKIGLLVNPLAGLGGAVGLKGSDGDLLQQQARQRAGQARGASRVGQFLQHILTANEEREHAADAQTRPIEWVTWGGEMGADCLAAQDIACTVLGSYQGHSNASDTMAAVECFIRHHVDLVIFAGGDGTARDVLRAATAATSFLGLPAGVKMHSGVFAISPAAAARVVADLARGRVLSRVLREVRDYVEPEAASERPTNSVIQTRAYGELWVPEADELLQQTKIGGRESEALAAAEIASYVAEQWADNFGKTLIVGPGSTCMQIKQALAMPATLLGFDVRLPSGEHLTDATAEQLLTAVRAQSAHVVLSFTRQQAFLLGRGNQQLTPAVLSQLRWPEDFSVVSSRSKLLALQQRPLLVDSDDAALDAQCCGLVEVLTGYDERSLYRVASPS